MLREKIVGLEKLIPLEEHIGGADQVYVWPFRRGDYIAPTSPFGQRRSPFQDHYSSHTGVDLLGVWHAQVVSIADGIIVTHYVPPDGDRWKGHPIYGGMLLVRHDDGSEALYAHLSETYVHEGNRVKAGKLLARQGSTGHSQGEHLHLELRINGSLVNPLFYLEDPR